MLKNLDMPAILESLSIFVRLGPKLLGSRTLSSAHRASVIMSDIEFVSELIVLTEKGIAQNGKNILDDVYAQYDDEIPNETQLYDAFERILEVVKALNLSHTSSAPFGNRADIYSLWAAIREVHSNGGAIQIDETRKAFLKLAEEIKSGSTAEGQTYSKHAQSNTNSFNSRKKRAEVIRSVIAL